MSLRISSRPFLPSPAPTRPVLRAESASGIIGDSFNRAILLLALVSIAILLAACSKQETASSTAAASSASKSSSPIEDRLISTTGGVKTKQLRTYLQNAEEIKTEKFDVKWHPDVVKLDRDAAMRSLVSINRSGSEITLLADDPAVKQLKANSILFVWGIALRRVVSVQTKGDNTIVRTSVVALNEAMTDANIKFSTPLNLKRAFVSTHSPRTPRTSTTKTSRLDNHAPSPRGRYLLVADELPPDLTEPTRGTGNEEDSMPPVEATPASTYSGSVSGFDYEVAYSINGSDLNFDLEARKAANDGASDAAKAAGESGAGSAPSGRVGGMAKGLFAKGYDDVDIRIKIGGALNGISQNDQMRLGSNIVITNSNVQLFNTEFKDVKGKVNVEAIARLGNQSGSYSHNFKVMDVPVTFNVPVIVAGIPCVVQVGFNFLVQIGLGGKHAALHTSGSVQFGGSGKTEFSGGQLNNSGDMSSVPALGEKSALSPGVSGFVVAVQVPKVGFGVGFTNANIMAYVDHVSVVSIVNTAAIGSIVQCARYTLSSTIHAGIETNFSPLPLPFMDKLSKSKTLFTKDQLVAVPSTRACEGSSAPKYGS